jgi:hypothetical protein
MGVIEKKPRVCKQGKLLLRIQLFLLFERKNELRTCNQLINREIQLLCILGGYLFSLCLNNDDSLPSVVKLMGNPWEKTSFNRDAKLIIIYINTNCARI